MKLYLAAFFILLSFTCEAQKDPFVIQDGHGWQDKSKKQGDSLPQPTYKRHSIIATVSTGFIDPFRTYTVPAGFEKDNTSGYTLLYGKLEYGFTKHISLAATVKYDAFYYNFTQLYKGYNGPIKRANTSALRIWSGGLTGFYHLCDVIHIKHLDPFVGVGITLNNIRYSNYPQGDSVLVKLDHTVSPYLKAGARYYISSGFSLFGDVGYDQQSIFSVGVSCRFLPRTSKP
jgi:hypothetical protein